MEKVKEFDTSVVPHLLKLPRKHYWVDYDEETDTLYANDSITEGNLIYHYDGDELVGVTVLNAKGLSG